MTRTHRAKRGGRAAAKRLGKGHGRGAKEVPTRGALEVAKLLYSADPGKVGETPNGIFYRMPKTLDPTCRHYVLNDVTTWDGWKIPCYFDAWLIDYSGGPQPNVLWVLLCPSAADVGGPFVFDGDSSTDKELLSAALDAFCDERISEARRRVKRRSLARTK